MGPWYHPAMTMLADGALLLLWGAAVWGAGAIATPLGWTFTALGVVAAVAGGTRRGRHPSAALLAIAVGVLAGHAVALGPLPTAAAWWTTPAGASSLAAALVALVALVALLRSRASGAEHSNRVNPQSDANVIIDANDVEHAYAIIAASPAQSRAAAGLVARPRLELLLAALATLALLAVVPPALSPLGVHLDFGAVWRPLGGAAVGLCAGLGALALLTASPRRRPRALSCAALVAAGVVALCVDAPHPPVAAPTRAAFPSR